eukprot:5895118-Amphidinium_carterae.1
MAKWRRLWGGGIYMYVYHISTSFYLVQVSSFQFRTSSQKSPHALGRLVRSLVRMVSSCKGLSRTTTAITNHDGATHVLCSQSRVDSQKGKRGIIRKLRDHFPLSI